MGDSENLRNFMEEAEFELSIEGWLGLERGQQDTSGGWKSMNRSVDAHVTGCTGEW